jgi:hypothetical protein
MSPSITPPPVPRGEEDPVAEEVVAPTDPKTLAKIAVAEAIKNAITNRSSKTLSKTSTDASMPERKILGRQHPKRMTAKPHPSTAFVLPMSCMTKQ